MQRFNQWLDLVWPSEANNRTRLDLFALVFIGGLALGWLTRELPMLGYDWYMMFHANKATDIYYPPWTSLILAPLANLPWRLGLALINGITMAAVSVTTYHYGALRRNPWRFAAALLALLSFQTLVVLWTGHIDGLALLAILGLPWLAPIVLMKATFVGFAMLARKTWLYTALVCAAGSLLLWPGWPEQLANTLAFRNTHPASAGWEKTGWLPVACGLLLLLNSKRTDWLQTVAAGSLMYPFLLPYHFLVLLPALGTLQGIWLPVAWAAAWLMVIPAGLYDFFWLYYLFPILIWLLRYKENGNSQTWLRLLNS